jgi:hypothetical protein
MYPSIEARHFKTAFSAFLLTLRQAPDIQKYPLSSPLLFFTEGSEEYLGNPGNLAIHPLLKTSGTTEIIVVNRFEALPVGDRKPPLKHLARGLAMVMLYLFAT